MNVIIYAYETPQKCARETKENNTKVSYRER